MDQNNQKELNKKFLDEFRTINGNNLCFDCNSIKTEFASINNGVFLCKKCSDLHRKFGYSISFIKSLNIDNW